MARLVAACLLLGALLCCGASASRSAPWERFERVGRDDPAIKWLQQRLQKKGGEEEDKAIIAIKYDVPPSMQHDFIDEWRKVQDATMQEEGTHMYDLKKTMGDNTYFWTYGEWESMDQYMEHFTSDYVKEFLDFMDDKDIMWHMYPLTHIADNGDSGRDKAISRRKEDDPRDMMAHVVIEYHVPPSKVPDFMDAWKDCADKTWDEKDNHVYALRKVASMNHHFVAYGTWETYDAYMDHFMAKHTRRLRKYLAEEDIMWFTDPLMSLGDTGEEELL